MPGTRPSRRHHTRQPPLHLLHHLAALLALTGSRSQPMDIGPAAAGAALRRRRQRLALAQRLLDPLPAALQPAEPRGDLFWRGLRWGSCGLLLALWLR